ncbi:AsmA family protein [Pedobacter sp. HMF7647]|uniref:AsmA family protein n=1 Tax=Hufsiella arboris TaxID=2695275 RepID=A0A7K1YEH5_9SPHI|nr:AsmA-like C-terminal region-containing protein [Hufsiella arboris]MXV53014.1 AsmA family protein [Hufsiella arboris]
MSRWLKISLIVFGSLIGFLLLLSIAASIYVSANKKSLLDKIMVQLNKNIHGKLTVGDIEPSLFKGFPGVAVSLKDVLLRDSLWITHRHDLLRAKDIDVSVNVWSLIAGNTEIKKIGINNATIYIYTDTSGYSNTSLFKSPTKKKPEQKTKKGTPEFGKFDFNNVNLVIDNRRKYKLFNFNIHDIKAQVDYPDSGWAVKAKVDLFVNNFEFNSRKGSFMKQKAIKGNLDVHYIIDKKLILVEPSILNIGGDDFTVGAKIDTYDKPGYFILDVAAKNILFKNAGSLLPPNISGKLAMFQIEKPMDVQARINGATGKAGEPLINVSCAVRNNNLKFPGGTITDCSFDGTYTNRNNTALEVSDHNSVIRFKKLSGKYYNAPFNVDTLTITDLKNPIARGKIVSTFPLDNLNQSLGGETFNFKNGTADLKLNYVANIDSFKFTKPVVTGIINIKDADILYIPRKLHLVKSALTLNFRQNRFSLDNGRFQVGNSILYVNGAVQNFWNFYYTAPEKIELNWNLQSPQLYLNEFIPFLGPRNAKKKKRSNNIIEQLSNVLDQSKVQMKLKVNKAIYDKFIARNLDAGILLSENGIYLQKMTVSHAGGNLSLTGNVRTGSNSNRFTISSVISHVNVKDFFYSFNNFGQTTLTSKNLTGLLSARVNASGNISDIGKVLPRSMNGLVIFNLQKASLLNFEPIQKVGSFVFANRDFNDIQIGTLDGTLKIKGDEVDISPMQINSSVLNFNVKGTYGLSPGKTNVEVDVPIRNPKKDADITDKKLRKERRMKGLVLHLKATDEEGKLKVKWNKDHD